MTTPTPDMRDVADRLLKWPGLGYFGANDVLVWWRNAEKGYVSIALRGDALKIQKHVLDPDREMLRNLPPERWQQQEHRGSFDRGMQRALGVDVGQTMSTPDEAYFVALDGIETAVVAALGLEEKFQYPSVFVTLMPNEGAPWNPGSAETEWYSAKKRKIFKTSKPSWVIEGDVRNTETGRDEKGLVADVCALVNPVSARGCGLAVVGDLRGLQIFATHSFSLSGRGPEEDTAANIQRCGGLLYPSLAVGHLPASNFGPLTLFADVRLALLGTKPYKERGGRVEVPLYGTDVWTETTSHFLSAFARDLFLQLTGNPGAGGVTNAPRYMAVLGPAIGGSGGPAADDGRGALIPTTTKLASVLGKRMKLWNEKADVKALTDQYWNKPERYPYLEAKVHAKVPADCFPLAAAPEPLQASALKFLRAIGYAGPLLLVSTEGLSDTFLEGTSHDEHTFAYAWRMRRAVLEYVADKAQHVVKVIE